MARKGTAGMGTVPSNDQVVDQSTETVSETPVPLSQTAKADIEYVAVDSGAPPVSPNAEGTLTVNNSAYRDVNDYISDYERRGAANRARVMPVLMRPTRASEVKTRSGGRGGELRYIPGDKVIARLIEATGGNYDVELVDLEGVGNTVKFFEIEQGGKMKPAMLVCVRLTIEGLGSKIGFGVQILQGGEDMYKGAFTDGLKKAATLLGLGLDLYNEEYAPEDDPVVLTSRQKLSTVMKSRGITSKSAANAEAQRMFALNLDALSDAQMDELAADLSRETVAF